MGILRSSLCATMTLALALAAPVIIPRAIPADEARTIAKEAYIYGYPLVDNYRIQYSYFVDREDPAFKAPWNQISNNPRVYTPEDRAVLTPATDVLYSQLGADLRAEPLVLTVPAVESGRYYSLQFTDLCTFNFGYIGSRATGNGAGSFLLAGPGWKGKPPKGIRAVIQSDTDFAFVLYRTQLFDAGDIEKVKAIQAGYKVQPLSKFLGTPAPAAPPSIDFIKPVSYEEEPTSLEFFNILNFVLRLCPPDPSEAAMLTSFAKLNIGAGKTFDAEALSPAVRKAVEAGMADAWRAYEGMQKQIATGEITSAALFGTRAGLKGMYLFRMAGVADGIYGSTIEEAYHPDYFLDSTGQPLDGSGNRYSLRFAAGQLPPVNSFWSLAMYSLPSRALVENPVNRYVINSPMLPHLKHDPDGGVTLYIQRESPGPDKESNWLPAPDGPFLMALQLYWPKPAALRGKWMRPKVALAK